MLTFSTLFARREAKENTNTSSADCTAPIRMFFPLLAYHHQIIMYSWRIPVLSFLAKSNMHFINNNTWGRTTERVRSHCGEKINFVPTSKV